MGDTHLGVSSSIGTDRRWGGVQHQASVRAPMAWIDWIDDADADGSLQESYARHAIGRRGIDHILKIHSLNPPSLEHHAQLYEHLMRGPSGLSLEEREMIAVVVSRTNDCHY